MIQVGTGGFGATWCREFLQSSLRDGRVQVVAAVDLNPAALQNAQRCLGLPPERCYTSLEQAFAQNPADFCTIVVPPAVHEAVVDLALQHDMDILSEKPIADTLEASVRIVQKVTQAGSKMGVTMILGHRGLEVFDYDPAGAWATAREGSGRRIPLLRGSRWGHALLIEQFIDWLDGGDPMETNVEDNLRSVALVAAAVRSSRTEAPVNVAQLLERTLREVRPLGSPSCFPMKVAVKRALTSRFRLCLGCLSGRMTKRSARSVGHNG